MLHLYVTLNVRNFKSMLSKQKLSVISNLMLSGHFDGRTIFMEKSETAQKNIIYSDFSGNLANKKLFKLASNFVKDQPMNKVSDFPMKSVLLFGPVLELHAGLKH